ncbi:MAG: hypothetical protein KM310_00295 [Clostridiales bacterium]|nr:hypothetical protein [Clostridiales bacterium]
MITDAMKEQARKLALQYGLDPDTHPFRWIQVRGQDEPVLYADRTVVDQLLNIHNLSVDILDQGFERFDSGLVIAWAKARVSDTQRSRVSLGAVRAPSHSAHALANALMRAETKAIRRAVIRFLAIPALDESELDTMETSPAEEPKNADTAPEEDRQTLIQKVQELAQVLRQTKGDLAVRSAIWSAVPRKASSPDDYSLDELRRIYTALETIATDTSA